MYTNNNFALHYLFMQEIRHSGHYDSEVGEICWQSGKHCPTENCRIDRRKTENRHAALSNVATVCFNPLSILVCQSL